MKLFEDTAFINATENTVTHIQEQLHRKMMNIDNKKEELKKIDHLRIYPPDYERNVPVSIYYSQPSPF